MLRKLIICTVICLSATAACATEADFEKRMARGAVALDAADYATAREEFGQALNEHPQDAEAALSLAVALTRGNDPTAETALKNALRLEPGNVRTNFELGSYFFNHGMLEESADFFETTLTLQPDSEMKAATEAYLGNIRARSGGKRWGVTLVTGMQYDSNVPLAADPSLLPVGTGRMGDWKVVLNPAINGVAHKDSTQELTGSYSLYQTLHLQLNNFNLTQNSFDVTYKRQLSPVYSAHLSGGFESIMLGGEMFDNNFSVTPGVTMALPRSISLGLDYRLRQSYFKNSDTFPTNTDRDGATHSLLISYHQPLSETVTLRAGYAYDRELTSVNAWSSIGHSGSGGVSATLPHGVLVDLAVELAARTYDEILTGNSDIRSDTTVTGGGTLIWQAFEKVGLSLGYQYTRNNSNISGYEYNRGITSVMLQGRY